MTKISRSTVAFANELLRILKDNAPVRQVPSQKYRRASKAKKSIMPGNLRNNGIQIVNDTGISVTVVVGGDPAPYGVYTETRSHRKGWMAKSQREFLEVMRRWGGTIR